MSYLNTRPIKLLPLGFQGFVIPVSLMRFSSDLYELDGADTMCAWDFIFLILSNYYDWCQNILWPHNNLFHYPIIIQKIKPNVKPFFGNIYLLG